MTTAELIELLEIADPDTSLDVWMSVDGILVEIKAVRTEHVSTRFVTLRDTKR